MHHVAIMNKKWNLIEKIISGQKKIESRWYKSRFAPWDKIQKGDVVFFKNSGENITAKAEVHKVLQFENLNEDKIRDLIEIYGERGKYFFQTRTLLLNGRRTRNTAF